MVSFSGSAQLSAMIRSSSSTSSMSEYRGGGRSKSWRRTDPVAVVEDCKRNKFGYWDCPCRKTDFEGKKCVDRFLSKESLYAHYFTAHYQLPDRHYCGACSIRFNTLQEREEHNANVHFANRQLGDNANCATGNGNNNQHHHYYHDSTRESTTSSCSHYEYSYTGRKTTYCYDSSSADEYAGTSTNASYRWGNTKGNTEKLGSEHSINKSANITSTASQYHYAKKNQDYDEDNKSPTSPCDYAYSYSEDYSKGTTTNQTPVHTYQVNTADYYNSHVMKNNYNSYVDLKHSVHYTPVDTDNVQNAAFGAVNAKNCNYKPSQHHLCHVNHHTSHINHG